MAEGGPSYGHLNLYDYRDVVTRGALLARRGSHQTVYTRLVLDALDADGLQNYWRLVSMVLNQGGTAFLEYRLGARGAAEVEDQIKRLGGEVRERNDTRAGTRQLVAGWQP